MTKTDLILAAIMILGAGVGGFLLGATLTAREMAQRIVVRLYKKGYSEHAISEFLTKVKKGE